MLSIFAIVAPVFVIILLGFVAAKRRYLPKGAGPILAEFAFKVAMPPLLFRAALNVEPAEASPIYLWAAYLSAIALIWVMTTVATRAILRRPAADSAAVAMGATFGNTVMLGIPVGLVAFGPDAATPMALMVAADAPLLWIAATLQQEWTGRQQDSSVLMSLGGVLRDLLLNPIIMSLLLGTVCRYGGLTLDPLSDRILILLGQAAIPSALFALGMTVAGFRLRGQAQTLSVICTFKLLIFPIIAWGIVTYVIALPELWAKVVILFAALPVGANAYLFAARYDRAVASVSAAIAASTLMAALTLTLVLALLKGSMVVGL